MRNMINVIFFALFLALHCVNALAKPTITNPLYDLSAPERFSIGNELASIFLQTIGFNEACRLVIEKTPSNVWALGETSWETRSIFDQFSNNSYCNFISERLRRIYAQQLTMELTEDVKVTLEEAGYQIVNNFCCVGLLTLQGIPDDSLETDQSSCCRTLLSLREGFEEPIYSSSLALTSMWPLAVMLVLVSVTAQHV